MYQPDHLLRLNEILAQYSHHVSTPNILTETSNLIGSGKQQLCKGACRALGAYIANLQEVYVPSKNILQDPLFEVFGLADASLYDLARYRGDHIFTADGPLYGRLTHAGVSVSNFWHEVSF